MSRILSIFEVANMANRRGQRLGHVYAAGGRWYLRYRVDTPQGRERIAVPIAWSDGPQAIKKREAQRVAWNEYLSQLDIMSIRPSSMRTLKEFIDAHFKPDVIAHLKLNTQLYYRSTFNHILPMLGDTPLRNINPAKVQFLINDLSKRGLTKTVRHVHSVISAVFGHAKAMGWYVGDVPTIGVRMPPATPVEKKSLTWDQVCTIAQALLEPLATLVILLTLTGLRIGEACGLRWKWTNLTSEMKVVDGLVLPPMSIAIMGQWVRGKYQMTKTPASARKIPLPEWLATRLSSLPKSSSDDPVFLGTTSKPIDAHNMAKRKLKPIVKKLGLPWVSWHTFRHTNASLGEMAGVTLTEKKRVLGQSSDRMAMHYSHADLEALRPKLERMVDPQKLIER